MKSTLPWFYFVFMLISLGLFNIENERITKPNEKSKFIGREAKETKEVKTNKKSLKRVYRYSNLC